MMGRAQNAPRLWHHLVWHHHPTWLAIYESDKGMTVRAGQQEQADYDASCTQEPLTREASSPKNWLGRLVYSCLSRWLGLFLLLDHCWVGLHITGSEADEGERGRRGGVGRQRKSLQDAPISSHKKETSLTKQVTAGQALWHAHTCLTLFYFHKNPARCTLLSSPLHLSILQIRHKRLSRSLTLSGSIGDLNRINTLNQALKYSLRKFNQECDKEAVGLPSKQLYFRIL